MSIDAAIVAALNGHAGVSGLTDGRVYPIALPAKVVYPAVVYQLVSRAQAEEHPLGPNGPAAAPSLYQFDCYAKWGDGNSFASLVALAGYVKAALIGLMETEAVDVVIQNTMDFNEPELLALRRMVEVLILHEEGES